MRPTERDLNGRRPAGISKFARSTAAAVCIAALTPAVSAAQDFVLHVEPAVALWLDKPQSNRFTPGFYGAIRPGIQLGPVVGLQLSYAHVLALAGKGFDRSGAADFLTAGVRLRPLASRQPADEQLGGLFVDLNAGYVRTADLDRFGFDSGLGYGFQVAPWFSIGPVLRYAQIVQPNDMPDEDPNDAQFITLGLDLAFGSPPEKPVVAEVPVCPTAAPCVQPVCEKCKEEEVKAAPVVVAVQPCPDADGDGVCDAEDRCPAKPGPEMTLGCPPDPCTGDPLVVLVQFKLDSAGLPPPEDKGVTMYPVLNQMADAIAKDPSCRVCIVGHASNDGDAEYNEGLSRRRANAVQRFLKNRGIRKTRMPVIGLGERCQISPETSRSLNRRVEFRRLQQGESCPTECLLKNDPSMAGAPKPVR